MHSPQVEVRLVRDADVPTYIRLQRELLPWYAQDDGRSEAEAIQDLQAASARVRSACHLLVLDNVPVGGLYLELDARPVLIDDWATRVQGEQAQLLAQAVLNMTGGQRISISTSAEYIPTWQTLGALHARTRICMRHMLAEVAPVEIPASWYHPSPDDQAALAVLIENAYAGSPDEALVRRMPPAQFVARYFSATLPLLPDYSWLAPQPDRTGLAGIALVCTDPDSRRALLAQLAVAHAYRRQGLGKRLLLAALQSVNSAGLPDLTLWVAATNADAIRLYEQTGFVEAYRKVELMLQ